ncbi:MAG: cell wall hydrolase [Deltaproteobacteria bacterium]|nr:cell wall hydrolase [Deltaproteobacteria bacterium]
MKKFLYFTIILPFIVTGCLSTGGEGDFPSGNATQKEKDVSGKLALALGGNAEGHDLVTVDGGAPKVLEFKTENGDLFKLEVPSGFGSFAEARSARLVPQKAGIGYLTPIVDSREREPVQITIPPQKLIQILFGEAGGQLAREASRGEFDVKSSSVSVTGDALGAVIRNRIRMINDEESPALFKVDAAQYSSNPPSSYYEAVIEAEGQFNPVNPGDENNDRYLDAVLRSSLRNDDDLIAYDQSVLTAADIFNEETEDPTEGAFAFYSPTDEEYLVLKAALETADVTLPDGAGTSDAKFPNLAPVQVLILKEIATATSRTNRPSFVFVRERDSAEPAVTDVP